MSEELYEIIDDDEAPFLPYLEEKFKARYESEVMQNETLDEYNNKVHGIEVDVLGKQVSVEDTLDIDRGSPEDAVAVQDELKK